MKNTQLIMAMIFLTIFAFPVAAGEAETSSQKRFTDISSSVAMKVMERASKSGKTVPVVVDHELEGVTPEMITWWWDNIDNTERYKLWHPKDHIAFEWVDPPTQGHVGTIQKATEKIGGIPMALLIRWEDPKTVDTDFEHVLAASIVTEDGMAIMHFSHEYEATDTGSRMRSTFHVPKSLYPIMGKGIRKHNVEEMSTFPEFLPDLYRENVENN